MDPSTLADLLVWFVVFVFSTTCHEAAHAWLAHLGGDSTAYEGGQVSLDPVPHMRREPFGMVVLPLLSFVLAKGSWMLGFASAPFDPRWAQRNPKKYALMSAAGPLANFILAALAFIAIWQLAQNGILALGPGRIDSIALPPISPDGTVNPTTAMFAKGLSVALGLNIVLGVFNLIPLPPLDGGSVVEGLWPRATGGFYQRLRSSPGMTILALLVAMNLFGYVGWPIYDVVIMLLHVLV